MIFKLSPRLRAGRGHPGRGGGGPSLRYSLILKVTNSPGRQAVSKSEFRPPAPATGPGAASGLLATRRRARRPKLISKFKWQNEAIYLTRSTRSLPPYCVIPLCPPHT